MRAFIGAALVAVMVAGCAVQPRSAAPDALYRELGGQPGVTALVDELLNRIADDERIVHLFFETDIVRLRRLMIEQICDLSGGPCEYSGETMLESHRGHGINERHFNAMVEDLIDAMESLNIAVGAQNRLLRLLAPMHPAIVEA